MQDTFLDETEVVTRILYILNQFKQYDLANLDWKKPFDEQGIDSLETTAFITSIEHEFHLIFEDNVFESFENFSDIKKQVCCDHNAFWEQQKFIEKHLFKFIDNVLTHLFAYSYFLFKRNYF